MPKKEKKQAPKKENSKQNELIQKLEKDLEAAKINAEEMTSAYQRAAADLQNFKRRTEEDQKSLVSFANANLILEILPILDNFERALKHKPDDAPVEWLDGVVQIYNQFKKMLEKQGLEEIKTVGEKLDPNLHDAMLHCEGKDGIIVQELEKGYILKEKVIRPAKVSVGNGN